MLQDALVPNGHRGPTRVQWKMNADWGSRFCVLMNSIMKFNMFKAESATNHKVSQHVSQHVLTCAVRCIRSRSGRQAADTAEHPQDRGEAQPNSKA